MLQFASFQASATTPPTFIGAATRNRMHTALGRGGSAGSLLVDEMGMSWMISESGGRRVSIHAGTVAGHSAVMAVVPSERFAVVVMTNADYAQDLALEIARYAMELFLGITPPVYAALPRPVTELDRLAGTYVLLDGPRLVVSRSGDELRLDVQDDRSGKVASSGALEFVSPLTARVGPPESPRYVDFVRDHDGRLSWLRYLGELAIRQDTGADALRR
jgi:hypothetical protein